MNLTKQLEDKLNNMNEIEQSFKNLTELLEANKKEHNVISDALSCMEEREREVLTRICINREPIEALEKDFNVTGRQIYNWKNKALESLVKRIYGVNKIKGDK